jgi:hypothetical protein
LGPCLITVDPEPTAATWITQYAMSCPGTVSGKAAHWRAPAEEERRRRRDRAESGADECDERPYGEPVECDEKHDATETRKYKMFAVTTDRGHGLANSSMTTPVATALRHDAADLSRRDRVITRGDARIDTN